MRAFRILGPFEVLRDGQPVALGAARQRALLAALLLRPGEVVASDRLIEDLWGEDPPPTADHMLHVYVSRLRKSLEGEGGSVLLTRPPGYLLRPEPDDEVDAVHFESLVREARGRAASDPEDVLGVLEEGLALWRGPALADFAFEAFAQPSAARLEELRAVAEEERIEALLTLGRHQEAIPELETLVPRYPLRERLRRQQMLALYRAGRQADALTAYQAARRVLADELGIDPGPALQDLEARILRQEPELLAPEPPSAPVGPAPSEVAIEEPEVAPAEPEVLLPAARPPERRRPPWALPTIALVLLVLIAIVAAVVGSPSGEGSRSSGSASPTPSGSRQPSALRLDWTEVGGAAALFGGPGDQALLGGAHTPAGYVALGYTAPPVAPGTTRNYDAAVWVAGAPLRWKPVVSTEFGGPGNQRATDAASIGDRVVIVGVDGSSGDLDGAVWKSDDHGATWSRVTPLSPAFLRPGGDEVIRAVTLAQASGFQPQLVAVGFATTGDNFDAAVWKSIDGLRWSFLENGGLGGPAQQQMDSVVAFHDLVVAGGFVRGSEGEDAAIWVSRDNGDTWERVSESTLGGAGDQQINAIASAGSELVAVGGETIDGDTNAAVWTSTDGVTWERVADPSGRFRGPGTQRMFTVAASRLGIVAAGQDGVGDTADAAVWTSFDGIEWARQPSGTPAMSAVANYGGEAVNVLLPAPGRFLALGAEFQGTERNADVWVGRPVG